jgi:AcrR family transcriptional regulator
MANAPARTPRKLSLQKREIVLDTAADVIRERGLAGTRISDVGARAGMSDGHVMYYFGSKDNLLMEAARRSEDRFFDDVTAAIAAEPTPAGRIFRMLDLWCPTGDTHEASTAWVLWPELWARSMRHPGLAELRESLDRRWMELVTQTAREAGQTDAGARDFAVLLLPLLDGLALRVMAKDPDMTPSLMRATLFAFTSHRLGLKPTPDPASRKNKKRRTRPK